MTTLDNTNELPADEKQGGLPAVEGKQTDPAVTVGKKQYSQAETNQILANMQELVERRKNPLNQIIEALKDATAWTGGGIHGPTATLAARDQQKRLQEEGFQRMQMEAAQIRAAQEQMELDRRRFERVRGRGGDGNIVQSEVASMYSSMTPEARMRFDNARNPTEALAILDEDLKNQGISRGKGQFEAAGNKPEKYFVPGVGYVDMTPNQFLNLPKDVKEKIEKATLEKLGSVPTQQQQPAATAPTRPIPVSEEKPVSTMTTAQADMAPLSMRNNNPGNLRDKKTGDFLQFSSMEAGQKALDEDLKLKLSNESPAVKERFGDVKMISPAMLAEVWSPATAKGNTPESTINYSKAIANKLGIDPTEPIPNTPQARQLVAQAITEFEGGSKIARAPAEVGTAKVPPPPVGGALAFDTAAQVKTGMPEFKEPKPEARQFRSSSDYESAKADWEKRRDAHMEVAKRYQEQIGGKSAESFAEAEKRFVTLTDQPKLAQRERITNELDGWLKKWGTNPRVLEVLSKPTLANAVADAIKSGVMTPVGGFSIPGMERLVQSTMSGLKKEEVTALKQLDSILGPRILQIVEQTKGASSDKDWNAFTQIAGNASTGYDFLNKAVKYDRASLKADRADRQLYNSYIKPGEVVDYRAFASDQRRNAIYDEYQKNVQQISSMQHEVVKAPARPAGMPKDVPAQYSPSTNSYWIGDKEYKVKQ